LGLLVDASSPARFSGTPANGVNIASASFTPPAGSILEQHINGDSTVASSTAVSDSTGLTWTLKKFQQPASNHGYSAIWTAVQPTSTAMTVSCQRVTGDKARISCKCYVLTGGDTITPAGNTGGGESTTNAISPTLYTSSAANSLPTYCGTDWTQRGVPTSTDTEDAADYAGTVSVMSAYGVATAGSGATIAGNLDAFGTSAADWSWAAVEIKPAAVAGSLPLLSPSIPLALLAM
jgi:hypothetical protein